VLAPATTAPAAGATLLGLCLYFLKIGATLFGSGYVLVSYLQSGVVDQHHWLTQRELLDAISVGQFTPGPLLTTATFVGFLIGHHHFGWGTSGSFIGAVAATVSIFLPSFVLVALCAPILNRLRKNAGARAALDAMNAAVVALLALTTFELARKALNDYSWAAVAGVSLVVLLRFRINATWIILAGAAFGLARTFR
jgi:chromate transporter